MTEKLTDNDIKKDLEDYIKENEFEYFHSNTMGEYPLIRNALDYINRLEAENENLQDAIDERDIEIAQLYKRIDGAYKEFAERVKKEIIEAKYQYIDTPYTRACNQVADWCVNLCDNLLKEMIGE